ncbi:MAG: DedA family protein [Planctomycetota bacterium]|nr:DedA family protein [Planctomycetota bacterium]
MTEFIKELLERFLGGMQQAGYTGVFLMMTIESSFIPFPSEIVMVPAGYLAGSGQLSLVGCIAAGIAGSVLGAWINYGLSFYLGRTVLIQVLKYFLISESKLQKTEQFFEQHGAITTLIGRLIPGVRQLISVPAGLARMNFRQFTLFTSIGAGAWVTLLCVIGYLAGKNQQALEDVWVQNKKMVLGGVFIGTVLVVTAYVFRHYRRDKRTS